jgi:Cu(I)/Ag(I) efflux system membrane fusion protein
MKRAHVISLILLFGLANIGAWLWWWQTHAATPTSGTEHAEHVINGVVQDDSGKTVAYWYDPMVPTQKFDKPGKSPFMDMQLEPKYVEADAGEAGPGENNVAIPAQIQQNLGIRLATASRMPFGETLSAVGRIEPNQRGYYVVQTRVPGFVERLSVRAVGDRVAKGQKLAEVYAPELLAAQQEYLALLGDQPTADSPLGGEHAFNTRDLAQAARHRLKLLGMSEGEIAAITQTGRASARFSIYAPASGMVTELGLREGAQLMPGNSLMQITDFSNVWLMAEIPERDAGRIQLGSEADIQLQSLPGEHLTGKVSYVYPVLESTSRTMQVRIELPNKVGNLRPGMFANVLLAGAQHEAIAVPSEAVIVTGVRKVVIVKLPGGFKPVEVTTGEEHVGNTEIRSGLTEGEQVVASGQFLIDSEASLSGVLAKLSQSALPDETQMTVETAGHKGMSAENMPQGRGKVTAIDRKNGQVTLAHEPIADLGWPAMTMAFEVKEAKQLDRLKPGDEVSFDLRSNPTTDAYEIVEIHKQPRAVKGKV